MSWGETATGIGLAVLLMVIVAQFIEGIKRRIEK